MKKIFTDFRSALMFITIIPAGKNVAYSPVGMIKFFPVVGLVIGALLCAFDICVSALWTPGCASVLDVVFLAAVTGAFHLDGLGDTADGIFSHRSRQRALEIMKDSRTGMMGLVAVVCVLAVKTAGLYCMKTGTSPVMTAIFLLIIPAYSRSSMVFGIRYLDYGRQNTGTGLDLFKEKLGIGDFAFMALPFVVSMFTGYRAVILNFVFFLTLVFIIRFYKKTLDCVTGDMLGAMNEVMEAVLLLAAGAHVF